MTRQECERKLIELAEQAMQIYRQYNPNGEEISIYRHRDGYISVSDITLDPDTQEISCWTLEGVKNADGEIYSMDYDNMTIEREEAST